jgi:hypothetical protein
VAAVTTTPRRRRAGLLLAAVALLAVAWLATPRWSTPPLYDGIAFPDEPYRYVAPPPGAPATPPAGSAVADARFFNGTSQPTYGGSNEQGPQVQIVVDEADVTAPSGATVVHLRTEPAAPTNQPPDARIWGNVYRLTATSDTGPAQIHTSGNSTTAVILRAPVGPTPQPVMEYTDGTSWHRLPLTRVGNDIYSSPIAGVGDYALATLPGQPQPVPGTARPSSRGIDRWVLIPGIALLVLLAAIAAIRWTRTTSRCAADMIDTEALLTYARMVAATATTMNLPADQQAALQDMADQLRQAATAPTPDPQHLRHLADDILTTLRAATPTLASRTAITLSEQAIRNLRRLGSPPR